MTTNKPLASSNIPRAKNPPKTRQTTPSVTTAPLPATDSQTASITPLAFTVITGIVPTRLTKVIGLNPDGTIRKETAANLSQGTAQRVVVHGLEGLRDHLDGLTSAQAVTWGVTRADQSNLCTNADRGAQQHGAIARTRDNFEFRRAPGLMMLDHDGLPNGSLSLDQFRARLLTAAPALTNAPMLGRPSASAGCQRPDGTALTPPDRHRIYIPVADASLIPEAGKALDDLL